jgi:multimeric flavodoxin WrbA
MILGVSGSPQDNGNLDRLVIRIMDKIGGEGKFIKLRDLTIRPCLGCVKCASTNRCIQKDDMTPLYDQILQADLFILGGVNYFDHPNAFTRVFMERLYCFRHLHPQTLDKLALVVAVGGSEVTEQVAQEMEYHLTSYFNYQVIGKLWWASATPPCFSCGYGTTCEYGGPARWMTKEEFEAFTEITPDMFRRFEDDPEFLKTMEEVIIKAKGLLKKE